MDFEEMNQRAYDRKPEPDGLTPAERMIWLALRLLYELHFHGGLTREEGVTYKQELKKDYERNLTQEAEWLRAGTAMKLLRQSENPEVKKIVGEVETMFWGGEQWQNVNSVGRVCGLHPCSIWPAGSRR